MCRAVFILYTILLLTAHPAGAQAFDKQPSYAVAQFNVKEEGAFSTNSEAAVSAAPTGMAQLLAAVAARQQTTGVLGFTKEQRPVKAYYFPGQSTKTALVIGGMHGSELAAIEVANCLVQQLAESGTPYYNVLIVPTLFPDNAAKAVQKAKAIGSTANIGRYTHSQAPDPNRQMPALGKPYEQHTNTDALGRPIEYENSLLLQLVQACRPKRLLNIHAIRDTAYSGIYADPRTDASGIALGFETDSSLAIAMAQAVAQQGGSVPGNRVDGKPTALYYKDPPAAPRGQLQPRNSQGSLLSNNRGQGVSVGSWASTAVEDALNPYNTRPAMRLLTMEFPGYRRPQDYPNEQQPYFKKQVALYALAIQQVFLANLFVEEDVAVEKQ